MSHFINNVRIDKLYQRCTTSFSLSVPAPVGQSVGPGWSWTAFLVILSYLAERPITYGRAAVRLDERQRWPSDETDTQQREGTDLVRGLYRSMDRSGDQVHPLLASGCEPAEAPPLCCGGSHWSRAPAPVSSPVLPGCVLLSGLSLTTSASPPARPQSYIYYTLGLASGSSSVLYILYSRPRLWLGLSIIYNIYKGRKAVRPEV